MTKLDKKRLRAINKKVAKHAPDKLFVQALFVQALLYAQMFETDDAINKIKSRLESIKEES